MKTRPVHENLDTSFVNVSSLIRYLRHRHFVGRIAIELNGYEAEVVLLEGNKLKVSEHDRLAGRIAEGEEALQRLLVRSRDPGGIINVFQFVEEPLVAPVKPIEPISSAETPSIEKPVKVLEIAKVAKVASLTVKLPTLENKIKDEEYVPKAPSLPNFPFSLSNKFESKAKQLLVSPQDWQILIQLTSELLRTIDSTLALAKLDFPAALIKIQAEISEDYPFLNPKSDGFIYTASRILIKNQINTKIYVASLNEIVRRVLDKLRANTKFAETYKLTHTQLVALFRERKSHYDRFGVSPQLAKTLNIKQF